MDQNNIDKLFNSHLNQEREFTGSEQVWSSLESRLKDNRKIYLIYFFGAALLIYLGFNHFIPNSHLDTHYLSPQPLNTELSSSNNTAENISQPITDVIISKQSKEEKEYTSFPVNKYKNDDIENLKESENASYIKTNRKYAIPYRTANDHEALSDELKEQNKKPTTIDGLSLLAIQVLPKIGNFLLNITHTDLDQTPSLALQKTKPIASNKPIRFSISGGLNHRVLLDNNIVLNTPTNIFGQVIISLKQNWAFQLRIDPLETNTILPSFDSKYNLELPYSPFELEDIESIIIEQKKLRISAIVQHKILSVKRHKIMLNAGVHIANSTESDVTYNWQTVYGQQEIIQPVLAETFNIDNISIGLDANFSIVPLIDLVGTVNYHHPVRNRINNWNNEVNLSLGLRMNLN